MSDSVMSNEKELEYYLSNELNRKIFFELFPPVRRTNIGLQVSMFRLLFKILDPIFYDWDQFTKWDKIKSELAILHDIFQGRYIQMMLRIIDGRFDRSQNDVAFIYDSLNNINARIEAENNQLEFPQVLSHSIEDNLISFITVRGFLKDKKSHFIDTLNDSLKTNPEYSLDAKKIVDEYISKYNEFKFEVKEGYEKIFKNSGEVLFAYLMENCSTTSKKADIGYFYRSMESEYLKVGVAEFRKWIKREYNIEISKIKHDKSNMDTNYNVRQSNYKEGLAWFRSTSYYGN